ncbi:HD domain-containing protein 2 [Haplosporangium sp. Z 767]|nr:HD domain-containing protein 2 [Haplosporangium sp. Z 767]
MDTFSADSIAGSSQNSTSPVVRLQYNGAVYDNSIRVLPNIDNSELYHAARSLANFPESTPISLLRLDHHGELVSNPRCLIDGELLEIMEGTPEDAAVNARMTELESTATTQAGSDRKAKVQSRTKRTGWINHDVKPAESIADHMYRMSVMTLLIDEKTAGVDKDRCIKMAIVHDLAESLVGDITPFDGVTVEDKHMQERNAMHHLCHELLGWSAQAQEISSLWEEYEAATTPEALLVKDFDKFEMIMQALEYEKSENVTLEDFFAGTRGKFKHPMVTAWVNELEAERAESRAIKS